MDDIICRRCGKRMSSDFFYGKGIDCDAYKKSYRDNDGIEQWSERFVCECGASVKVLHRNKVEVLSEEQFDWKDPEPKVVWDVIESIKDLPEPDEYKTFCIKKGYYSGARCYDGKEWTLERRKSHTRCEDCIYFSYEGDLEEVKRNPKDDGSPNGTCSKGFRMKEDCPMNDRGE